MKPIVIVGSGLAGWTVARELRRRDPRRPLVLACAGNGDFYPKPALSNALAQGKQADQLVTTPADRLAAQLGVELMARTRVEAIDRAARELVVRPSDPVSLGSSGAASSNPACSPPARSRLAYGQLVLATGALTVRPRLTGDAAGEVLQVNDLDGYRLLRERLEGAKRVLILGAGLIGCEFANDLAGAGLRVVVIDPAPRALATLLPPEASALLQARLAARGVRWRLGRGLTRLDRAAYSDRARYLATLDDGSLADADLVIAAIGLRPDLGLASAAGLATGRGIVVDAQMRTSDPAIYALGDAAEVEGRLLPYVQPIMLAGRAIAASLTGTATAVQWPAMPVVVKTPALPLVVLPGANANAPWQVEHCADGLRAWRSDASGRLTGFVLAGSAGTPSGERQRWTDWIGRPGLPQAHDQEGRRAA